MVYAAQAYTTFGPTCTLPSDRTVNFVSSPNTRGTLDILWGCLFTLLACTWTIQHLNVPAQRKCTHKKGRKHSLWCDLKWTARAFRSNIKWMILTIMAPELILGKAIGDFMVAWQMREKMKSLAEEDGTEWTLAHGFFANMGGFTGIELPAISDVVITKPRSEHDSDINESASLEATNQHILGPVPLTAANVYWLRKYKNIDRLPDVTVEEIHDKSKGNIFVKTVTVTQVVWVSLQLIIRYTRGLDITHLELSVAASSVCATITYIILIQKPQGVQVPFRPMECKPGSIKSSLHSEMPLYLDFWLIPVSKGAAYNNINRSRIPNDFFGSDIYHVFVYLLGIAAGAVIFGGIHVAGWNFEFPTPTEQQLWRTFSLIITVVPLAKLPPLILYCLRVMRGRLPVDRYLRLTFHFLRVLGFILSLFYILARLFILVEIFRSLLFLPPDAFVSTWTSSLSHVSWISIDIYKSKTIHT